MVSHTQITQPCRANFMQHLDSILVLVLKQLGRGSHCWCALQHLATYVWLGYSIIM